MPSSFTSNIAFEKPANGEQTGTWGNTVNDNMDILDRLTSQVGSIALTSSTYTLTTSTSGTVSEGHYSTIRFTGTPGATCTVSISPNTVQRIYTIYNNTNQTVIMSQGSGSTVSISAGEVSQVYSDGAGASAAVVDITPVGPTLAAIGALTPTDGNFIVGNGTTWVAESGNTVLTSIGVTATTTELNVLDGVTASTAELNILDGVTASTAELNFTDGVTSNIQTQLNGTVKTTDDQNVAGVKTFTTAVAVTGTSKAAGRFYAGTTAPTNTTRLNYDGALHATSFVGNGAGLTGISGGLVLLATANASASSSIAFTAFNSTLYGNYLFLLSNVVLSTDSNISVQVSVNGGFSYKQSIGDYAWWAAAASNAGVARLGSDSQTSIRLLHAEARTVAGSPSGGGFGINGALHLFAPEGGDAGFSVLMKSQFAYRNTSSGFVSSDGMGAFYSDDDGEPVDGIRFFSSNFDTITSGTFRMYGIAK